MDHAKFEALKQEFLAAATVDQLVDLERSAHEFLAKRVSEAVIAKRSASLRACPRCGSESVVRHGRDAGGRQRFLCRKIDDGRGCGRTFNAMTETPFARMRKSELWTDFTAHFSRGTSLANIAKSGIGISRHTAFRWRHRLLGALAVQGDGHLGGVVEADETFFLRSFKGHRGWKRGKPPENRPPRYRGSGALLPGISWQQVPILTAIDRNGRHLDEVMQKRSDAIVVEKLGPVIEAESVLCSDGFGGYAKLAQKVGAEHRVFEPPKPDWLEKAIGQPPRREGALGLGRVNSHHEMMKTLINRRLRGVSTRYLPDYLAMLRLERRPPKDLGGIIAATLRTANG
jgi:transposase-like protein